MKLKELGKEALKALGQLTFTIDNVKTKPSKTGNVGYQATCDNGKVVTFWDTNMDSVVEELDADKGLYGVKHGVQITTEGGLIAADAKSNGFWS